MLFWKPLYIFIFIIFASANHAFGEDRNLPSLIVNPSDGLTYEKFRKNPFTGELEATAQSPITGSYRNGLRQGEWDFFHENGLLQHTGQYESSKKIGLWLSYNDSGTLIDEVHYTKGEPTNGDVFDKGFNRINSLITYENGRAVGKILYDYGYGNTLISKIFFENGNETKRQFFSYHIGLKNILWYHKTYKAASPKMLAEIESGTSDAQSVFRDHGILHGPYERYSENGELSARGVFKEGYLDGEYEIFYENGSLEFKEPRDRGWKHGKRERYFVNGELAEQDTFKDGYLYKEDSLAEGQYTYYFSKGGPKRRTVNYKNGLKHGKETIYLLDGSVKEVNQYNKGKFLGY
jgi:uncharacterized protein